MIPRRKPTEVIEQRRTLGDYERQLEKDRIMIDGLKSAGSVLTGAGLVLIPIAGLAGFLFGNGPRSKSGSPTLISLPFHPNGSRPSVMTPKK